MPGMSNNMKFVIGDIHGEVTKLQKLIRELKKLGIDKLIFIGDYLDKGENSKATLDYLQGLSKKYHCIFLLGNHEYFWIKFAENGEYREAILKYGGKKTMKDFNIIKLRSEQAKKQLYYPYKDFFDGLKKYAWEKGFFISHSGINPDLVNVSQWDKLDEKEFIFQRLNMINYKKLLKGRRLIFGHTAFKRPFYDGYKIGIDTGAYIENQSPLTAFELSNEFFIDHTGNVQRLIDLAKSDYFDMILARKKKK